MTGPGGEVQMREEKHPIDVWQGYYIKNSKHLGVRKCFQYINGIQEKFTTHSNSIPKRYTYWFLENGELYCSIMPYLIFLSLKWSPNYSIYVKKKSYPKIIIEYHVKYPSKVKLIREPRSSCFDPERIIQARRCLLFTNHGHWPEWSCSWSGTNNRALPHLEFNRCQLRLNPFANVIPALTAICSFILFRLAVQYDSFFHARTKFSCSKAS